jgi:hypothetical protein
MSKQLTTYVKVYDITMEVSGYYIPEEPKIWSDGNMEGYPGAAAEFEIETIELEGIEISQIISDEVYNQIIEQVIEQQS